MSRFRSLPRAARDALKNAPYLFSGLIAALVLLPLSVVLSLPTPYQVLLPGKVLDVQDLIQPNPKPVKGRLFLTTIYSDHASVGEWLYARVNPEAGIIPSEQARPKDLGEREYQKVLGHEMDESKVVAQVVALREAGYDVKATKQAVQVQEIASNSNARGLLEPLDDIVEADGTPVMTANDLIARIQAHVPGESVSLRVVRSQHERQVEVPLGESPDEPGRARAGLVVATHLYRYQLPVELNLQTKDIAGPSGGLMLALGVYNAVAPGDVTNDHRIAGTGTISIDGKVGPVGGVKYKVLAAQKVGTEIFLVPQENYEEARTAARSLRVISVSGFKEALAALRALPPK